MSGARISDMTAIEALDLPSDAYVPVISAETGATNYKYELGKGVTDPFYKRVAIETFGGAPDYAGDTATATDNLQPLLDAIASFTYFPDFAGIAVGPEIVFGPGDYYFSDTINLKKIVRLVGQCSGQNNFNGATRFHFPGDTVMLIVNTTLTSYDEKLPEATSTAEGSTIRGIHFIPVTTGTGLDKPAIWLRGRANIERCCFGESLIDGVGPFSIGGNAISIIANVSSSGADYGNANNWRITECYVERCNGHGLYVAGTDTNAGKLEGFETRHCGLCGIYEASGLGNSYKGMNIAGYANASPLRGRVTHSGRHYQLISATAGAGSSTTPGTNNSIWYDRGTGSTWPTWSSSDTYIPDAPIFCTGTSNRSTFIGIYTENGTNHIPVPAMAFGGQTSYTNFSNCLETPTIGLVDALLSRTGIGGYKNFNSGGSGHSAMGDYVYTALGTQDPAGVDSGATILEHRRRVDGAISWFWHWDGNDQRYRFLNQKDIWRITGPNTTRTFGRSSAVPYMMTLANFAVRDPGTSTSERIFNIGTAVPTSGEVARGERGWLINASAGGKLEWVCTTAGTHGSTAVTKNCNAIDA